MHRQSAPTQVLLNWAIRAQIPQQQARSNMTQGVQQGPDALWEPLEAAEWTGPRRVDAQGVCNLWHVLQWAIQWHPVSVPGLLEAGALPDDPKRKGPPPLFMACRQAPQVVSALLAHGADVNQAEDTSGYTPLMEAACCHPHLVRMLLQAGAQPNVWAKNGGNAFWAWLLMSPERNRKDPQRWPKAKPVDLEAGLLLIDAGAKWDFVLSNCSNHFLVRHIVMNAADVSPLVDTLQHLATADTAVVRGCLEQRKAADQAQALRDQLPNPKPFFPRPRPRL